MSNTITSVISISSVTNMMREHKVMVGKAWLIRYAIFYSVIVVWALLIHILVADYTIIVVYIYNKVGAAQY